MNQKLRLLASLTRHDIISHIHIIRAFHSPWREKSDPDEILSYISCAQDQETGLSLWLITNTCNEIRSSRNRGNLCGLNNLPDMFHLQRIFLVHQIKPDDFDDRGFFGQFFWGCKLIRTFFEDMFVFRIIAHPIFRGDFFFSWSFMKNINKTCPGTCPMFKEFSSVEEKEGPTWLPWSRGSSSEGAEGCRSSGTRSPGCTMQVSSTYNVRIWSPFFAIIKLSDGRGGAFQSQAVPVLNIPV